MAHLEAVKNPPQISSAFLTAADDAARRHAAAANPGRTRTAELVAQTSHALAVYCDGARIGTAGLRQEATAEGLELVIVYAACDRADLDMVAAVLPEIEAIAAAKGAARVRFHTVRPGLVAKAAAAGYGPVEYVLAKDVAEVGGDGR